MKNRKAFISILIAAALIIGAASVWFVATQKDGMEENHSDEMKLDYGTNFADVGSDAVERDEDHTDTPEQAAFIYPLADNTMDNLSDAILHISLEEGGVYVDDIGETQMDVKIYSYDKYDMVDISMLKVGDIIVSHAGELEIASIDRKDDGSIAINGGLDAGGLELITQDNGIFYEQGYNDAKNWYQVGETTICVSADFEYHDNSDLDNGEILHYSDSFIDGGITDYFFFPHNTTIRVENGRIIEMYRRYVP